MPLFDDEDSARPAAAGADGPPIPAMQVRRHAPIREQVAAILRQAIVDLRLQPGQVLIERELCEMTSASRPSVREALRQLEAEGLVESVNGRGTIVRAITREEAQQVYVVRANLEGLAARLFAERAGSALRHDLRAAMAHLTESTHRGASSTSLMAAKNLLYDILFEGAGNEVLHQLVRILHHRVTQLRSLTLAQPGRPAQSARELQEIVDAIEHRDGEAADAAAVRHVQAAAAVVLGVLLESSSTALDSPPTPRP
ncbi:GntR family transcriptional regulator [Microbispora sp. NPDC088329]|uniref:GntR family transcriptional regulator n=1 Tax=Microbispora sp. NPDC088329 TaxID=3154869 RepID=UPI00344A1838